MNRLIRTALAGLASVLCLSSTAQGAFINGAFQGTGGSGYATGSVTINFTSSTSGASQSGTFLTGNYRFQRDSAAATEGGGTSRTAFGINDLSDIFVQASGDTFWTFCIELNQAGLGAPDNYDLKALTSAPDPGLGVGLMTANQADAVRQLWFRYHSAVVNANTAAAFQLALWEIIYDSESMWGEGGKYLGTVGYDLLGKDALKSSTTAAKNQANTWLRSLTGSGGYGYGLANLGALVSENEQDQIIELKPGRSVEEFEGEPVPAPAGLVLALCGVLPCVALRRRLLGTKAAE